MTQLERLDLSYNRLQFLDAATLGSLPRLLVLKVNFSLLGKYQVLSSGNIKSCPFGNIKSCLCEISSPVFGRYQVLSLGNTKSCLWGISSPVFGKYQVLSLGNTKSSLWEIWSPLLFAPLWAPCLQWYLPPLFSRSSKSVLVWVWISRFKWFSNFKRN